MKKLKSLLGIGLVLTICLCLFGCGSRTRNADTSKNDGTFNIVSSFYPMHILAMNLTNKIVGVKETSMSEPNIGCIHDHTFSTDDLKKVEGADVYIENGLGLEAFNNKIKKAYPDTAIVEVAKNITGEDLNPHVWTNIDYYISQVKYASKQLQRLNPENKNSYAANEKSYVAKLEQLKTDNGNTIKSVEGKKVLVLDEALPNFCKFLKMNVIEIETDHEEEALSADDLKKAIKTMNDEKVKTIFIAKDSDRSTAEAIAAETGATIYELNTCMVGNKNSTADAYITDMKENFKIIATIN